MTKRYGCRCYGHSRHRHNEEGGFIYPFEPQGAVLDRVTVIERVESRRRESEDGKRHWYELFCITHQPVFAGPWVQWAAGQKEQMQWTAVDE